MHDVGALKKRHSRCTIARSTRAAGVSPPWFGNSAGNGDRFSRTDYITAQEFAPHIRLCTTAGLHQPLLMHDVGALKKRHSRCTIACSQERRASARRALRYEPCAARITHRWPTARPWNRERRASTRRALEVALAGAIRHTITGYLACNQERRASARRGCGNRVCNGVRARTTSGSPLCGNCGVAATGALHKPRLAYASRS
jgi:hypothetical protein